MFQKNLFKQRPSYVKPTVDNTVDNLNKCASEFYYTAAECTVEVFPHCARWASGCTEDVIEYADDMFANCGINMIPFVPAD